MFDVFVVPNAKKTLVKREENVLRVHLAARPVKGRANKELIDALSDYFSVKKSDVKILSGTRSRKKTVHIITH